MLQKLAPGWSSLRSGLLLCAGLLLFAMPLDLAAQRMWINEFHYNNTGADTGEFVEVVLEAGTDPNDVFVQLYNGANGNPYGSAHLLTTFTAGDTVGCFEFYYKEIVGIQNGAPDGIVLAHQGVAVEFISYQGTFLGASGVAAGYPSVNTIAAESDATGIGNSLQRTGTGMDAGDFTWAGPSLETMGSINGGQNFSDPSLSATLTDTPQSATEPVSPGDTIKYTATIENTGDGDAKNALLNSFFADPNTTFVPGSFKSTPIAYDLKYNTAIEDAATFEVVLLGFDPDGDMLTYSITDPTDNGTLSTVAPPGPTADTASVFYTPNAEFFGLDSLEYTVTDDDGNMCPAKVYICVQPVNDPPVIVCGPDQVVVNTAGAQTIVDWLAGFSVGPANESFQFPVITLTNDSNALFTVQPSVNIVTDDLLFTPAPGVNGVAIVTATITDGVPADDVSCSFTITVQAAPDAMADDFSTKLDTDLNGDLFADNGNGVDDLGFPAGTIVTFGGGDAPGTVMTNPAGGPAVALGTSGGMLTVNANGTFSLTGQPFTVGTYSFDYRLQNAAGFDDATVTIVITPAIDPAICNADSYTGTGNIAIDIAAPGVLMNDGGTSPMITEVEGSGANIGVATAATNGTVTLNADGSFTFEPTAGFTGDASFDYTVDNALNQPSTCTVTITVSEMIWFVDNSAGGSNEGTFANPFQSIADFAASTGPGTGDFISLASGTYAETDGFDLEDNQSLIGEGVALSGCFTADANSVAAYTAFAAVAGTAPDIEPTADNGVDVADGNTLKGFNIDPIATFHGILGSAADGTIGMTASDITIGGTGIDGIEIPNASGTFSISSVSVIGSEMIGIDITTINASVADVTITGCTIDATGPGTGRGIDLEAFNTSTMTFDVIANPTLEVVGGTGVVIIARDDANMDGFVRNNPNIDMNGALGNGILVDARDDSDIVAEVSGNTIALGGDIGGGVRIAADNPGPIGVGSATLNATVNNNNITIAQNANFGRGLQLIDHNAHTLCANVTNNTITDASTNTDIGISIIDQSATPIQLQGLVGGPFTSGGSVVPGVNTWWTSQGNTDNADAGSTFLQGTVEVGTCTTPTP